MLFGRLFPGAVSGTIRKVERDLTIGWTARIAVLAGLSLSGLGEAAMLAPIHLCIAVLPVPMEAEMEAHKSNGPLTTVSRHLV